MIAETLIFLKEMLGDHFKSSPKLGLISDPVSIVVRNLFDYRGEGMPVENAGLSLTLVNIEEETTARRPYSQKEISGGFEIGPSPLYLNLQVLIAAEIKASSKEQVQQDYAGSLWRITSALQFFQANPQFTSQDWPALPTGVDKLSVRLMNLSSAELQSLWGYLGAKYMPSVVYKVSVLALPPAGGKGTVPGINDPQVNLHRI